MTASSAGSLRIPQRGAHVSVEKLPAHSLLFIPTMEELMKPRTRTRLGVALAAVLAIPAVAFAFGGPDGKTHDPAKRAEKRAAMIAQHDTNGDGQLDDAERNAMFDARAKEHFTKADANGDGALTFEEFKAARQMFKHHRRHGPPPANAPAAPDSK